MIAPGTVRGARGLVKAGYLTAAELSGYVLAREPLTGAWMVHAAVTTSDPYLLGQPTLEFVAPHKGGAWRWPIGSWQIVRGQFAAQLGALQES